MPEPRALRIQLSRSKSTNFLYDFDGRPQQYTAWDENGPLGDAPFPWERVRGDLDALASSNPPPEVQKRIGETLREFLVDLLRQRRGWLSYEEALRDAERKGDPISLVFRFGAVELFALPWELLRLQEDGQCLGSHRRCLLQYEWQRTKPAAAALERPGRMLFAWSRAGGLVPDDRHREALQETYAQFRPQRDELAHVTLDDLKNALVAAEQEGDPIRVLHILCHGAASGGSFGLVLNAPGSPTRKLVVHERLRAVLSEFKQSLQLVVLCACYGSHPGDFANMYGGVAHDLHRLGIPAVVASRMPLSFENSIIFTREFCRALSAPGASVQSAFHAGRASLSPSWMDWASLQLFAPWQRLGDAGARPAPSDRRVVFSETGQLPDRMEEGLVMVQEVNRGVPSSVVLDALGGRAGESPATAVLRPLGKVGDVLPSSEAEWTRAFEDADHFVDTLETHQLAAGDEPEVHLFGRAPLPLVFHLGWRLAQQRRVRAYQRHPKWGDTWSLGYDSALNPGRGEPFFRPATLPDEAACRSAGRLALTIEVTHTISDAELAGWLGPEGLPALVRLIAARGTSDETVEGPQDAARGASELKEYLNRIHKEHPAVHEVWLALACPASFAVALGRAFNRKVHPGLVLFNHRKEEGYLRVHQLGGRPRTPPVGQ